MSKSSPKSSKSHQRLNKNRTTIVLSLVLTLTLLTFLLFKHRTNSISSYDVPDHKWNSFPFSVKLQPSVVLMKNTEVIYQIPESPKAVLFIAHGCNGRAANFWDRSVGCRNCVGLPEERLVTLHALHRRYAVLAISSLGRCWSFHKEMKNVKEMINSWVTEHKLVKLPIVALGASSGGYFVSALAFEMKFRSIAIMIAEGVFGSRPIPENYPPTLFIHMPKDHVRMRLISKNMESLKKKGVPVKEIKCMEFSLTPTLFSNRIPGLHQKYSRKLYELFLENGFIDNRGYMKKDGRATDWKKLLKQIKLEERKFASHIEEELNLAFAYHEMTSLEMNSTLDWFDSFMN